jgi:transposase
MSLIMSAKEANRLKVITLFEAGTLSREEAAERMGVSQRQVSRIAKRHKLEGIVGLVSKRRGVPSNRKISEETLTGAMDLIRLNYPDFGPTLAAEKLRERHNLNFSVETVRRAMIGAGIWKAKRGNDAVSHPIRERRASFGEMIQIDGSPHDWFEGRDNQPGTLTTLLVFIDDATGRLTDLRFVAHETTLDYMRVLYEHIQTFGAPVSLYSDKHSIFRINAKGADMGAETQFSRAARELGIECIHAHSPQAKGRVERANQTLQDRLVKEMRLNGINNSEQANAWVSGYIKDFNRRFAVNPRSDVDAHSPFLGTAEELTDILSIQTTRTLSKNLSCQFENKVMQVQTAGSGLALRGANITVLEHFDDRCELRWGKKKLDYSVMQKVKKQADTANGKNVNQRVDDALAKKFQKPASRPISIGHAWKKPIPGTRIGDTAIAAKRQKQNRNQPAQPLTTQKHHCVSL